MAKSKVVFHTRGALLYVSLLAHLVWLVLFSYIVLAGPFANINDFSKEIFSEIGCEYCLAKSDAISTAYQMGRLELIGLSLTLLAVVLALGNLAGYFVVRGAAMSAAADEAQQRVRDALPELLREKDIVKAMANDEQALFTLANLVRRKISESGDYTDGEDDAANRIAGSFNEQ